MNNQDALNRVYQYFITEGHPAGTLDGVRCKYAGPCAVGIFIPVELRAAYDEAQASTFTIARSHPDIFGEVRGEFLNDLQSAHDSASGEAQQEGHDFRAGLAMRLQRVAKDSGLIYPGDATPDA